MSGSNGRRRPSAGSYVPYRDGKGRGLEALLREAVADFYRRYRSLPAEVVVHPTLADEAEEALKALDLARVPVAVTGGCLVWEVWLGLDGTSDGGSGR